MKSTHLTILLIVISLLFISCRHKSGRKNKHDVLIPNRSERTSQSHSLGEGSVVSAKVISIIDGDTYDALLADNKTIRIRMEGIDAPERGMPFYQKAKNHLSSLCFEKQVKIKITGIDNKRFLAYTYLENGQELSQEMIKAALAWHFKKHNTDKILANLEIEARNLKKGLWIEKDPMPPWTNRNLHRKGISTKDSFNIKQFNK